MLTMVIEETSQGATVLRCSGRIVKGEGADTLFRTVKSAREPHIQIELSEVSGIDAAGLGTLAELELWARNGNRTIQLMNPSTRVRGALDVTRLGSVLQICPSHPHCREAA
jgi:anti-anti-sigma factor